MVKQGPIPAFLHGLYEYVAGAALIAAPLLLSYKHGAATAVSIVLGILLIFLTATTSSTTSLVNQISKPAHIILDYVLVAILVASPFLFGFHNESTPTAIFIGGGVLHLLISIATRYRKDDEQKRGSRGAGRRGAQEEAGESDSTAPELERESRVRPSSDAVGDDEIPEFEPPPRRP
jgi:small neutral amino acid transporter SnatA (MarC family)